MEGYTRLPQSIPIAGGLYHSVWSCQVPSIWREGDSYVESSTVEGDEIRYMVYQYDHPDESQHECRVEEMKLCYLRCMINEIVPLHQKLGTVMISVSAWEEGSVEVLVLHPQPFEDLNAVRCEFERLIGDHFDTTVELGSPKDDTQLYTYLTQKKAQAMIDED